VEHDITFDLAQQLLKLNDTPDMRSELARWRTFESEAWRGVGHVVVMSGKDRGIVIGAPAFVVPNGVDLDRFRPGPKHPEARRVLFIGSFAHKPNVMAVEFFVNEVLPRLSDVTFHVIAGANHERFPVAANLDQPAIELEGFVPDVRPAYVRASVVVAPLIASAGTNIKVLEAMAMGKAVVSTPAGVNGLDLSPGEDFVLVHSAAEMADAIEDLFRNRSMLERNARATVERAFSWDAIAKVQSDLYRELLRPPV
jgi:glycosyltransferase involved in cell wall biosynthesis